MTQIRRLEKQANLKIPYSRPNNDYVLIKTNI